MRRLGRGGLMLACLGLAAALALPRIARERALPDVLAIVDITQSMNVMDETLEGRPVSRLAFVKRALQQAALHLPCGSKLGLGIFTQYRSVVLLLPVETCANRRELIDAIGGIDGQMAWAGGSEIAKGIYLTLRMLKSLDRPPTLAFITDGHEAPPISPRHRIAVGDEAGIIQGMIVGVGGAMPAPIPKVDPDGNPAGFWGPTEVMQHDLYAQGRQGTASNEMMEETGPQGSVPPALRGTPGQEHLSFLHEPYLEVIAAEAKLDYARLARDTELTQLFNNPRFNQPQRVMVDWRWLAGAVALGGLLMPYALRGWATSAGRRTSAATGMGIAAPTTHQQGSDPSRDFNIC